ncbi:MAG: SIR2 family protein [Friedmanniella sp.]
MPTLANGHVFVVRGRIGEMVADAALISTDGAFRVGQSWHQAVSPSGPFEADEHRPEDWDAHGWGRSATGAAVWFLDVTNRRSDAGDSFGRLRAALSDVADSDLRSQIQGRPLPLVVLPVIGTEGGGFERERGQVVERLLDLCRSFVHEHAIDIAIVATSSASYAAMQHQRRVEPQRYFEPANLEAAEPIGDTAQRGALALFIGGGASIPAGAPSWTGLISALATKAELSDEVAADLPSLSVLDQAELLHQKLGSRLGVAVAELVTDKKPALSHILLAALCCESAVTTNYDNLYELAVAAGGDAAATVLPTQIPSAGSRWLLKMHGDAARPGSIVLTRGQFVDFHAASGPSGAVLQSLLLTKHLLVVGTSMTDDNVLRLIHEVAAYRERNQPEADGQADGEVRWAPFGTILDVSGNPSRRELHRQHFNWVSLAGETLEDRARQLEVFLDAVALYASGDNSWLLDERFAFLLHGPERNLADRVRGLVRDIPRSPEPDSAWTALAHRLEEFGARPQE